VAAAFTAISLGFRHCLMMRQQQLHLLLWSGLGAVTLAFVLFLAAIFLLKISREYSRGAFIFEFLTVSISVCLVRTLSVLWLRSAVASGVIEARRIILIGDVIHHLTLMNELKSSGIHVIESIPLFASCAGLVPRESRASDIDFRQTVETCRSVLPDDVVILVAQENLVLASELSRCLSEIPCSIHIVPVGDVRFLARSQVTDLGRMRTLQVARPPLSPVDLFLKRILDLIVATAALVVLSPLLLIVALAIRLDSRGPILFRQKRHGYNNEVIEVFKFRSMVSAIDKDTAEFVSTTPDDGRVTAIGRILRRTSIDELPQLLNVLAGEMSIVGPRPHATAHNQMFENRILPFARRHNVKPGITGWAQVNGYRGAADTIERMQRRVEYDIYYIDNWSFFFDLKILMMTLFSSKVYTNAY
jgi:Undecaprenyl-phosphate glucose phosphotransferase